MRNPGDFELRRAFAWLAMDKAKRMARGGPEELPPERILEAGIASEEQSSQHAERDRIGDLRDLWCILVGFRFGGDIAERVRGALAHITDEDQLFEVGDCLVNCDTGDELLEYVGADGQERRARDRVSEWTKHWMREGREEGLKEGFERGLEQGRAEGLDRGLEHERALLRRLAALRFGVGIEVHFAFMLARIADPERLAEVGEGIIECEHGSALIERVERLHVTSAPGDGLSQR